MKKFAAAVIAGLIVLTPAATASAAMETRASQVAHPAAAAGALTQARRMAKTYLRVSAFSRTGLIEQLVFEGFSKRQATRAVDSITVSWRKQAAATAKAYLDLTAFSRSGLIEQLMFDGYTKSQAKYGVRSVGL